MSENVDHISPGQLVSALTRIKELEAERAAWAAAMTLGAEGTQFPRGIPDMTMIGRAVNRIVADDELHDVMNLVVGMARSIPRIERARIVELEARLTEVAHERNTTLVPMRDAADVLVEWAEAYAQYMHAYNDREAEKEVRADIAAYKKAKTPPKPFDPSDPTWDGDKNCPADERE